MRWQQPYVAIPTYHIAWVCRNDGCVVVRIHSPASITKTRGGSKMFEFEQEAMALIYYAMIVEQLKQKRKC